VLALLIAVILRIVVSLLKKRATVASVPHLTKQPAHHVAVVMELALVVSVDQIHAPVSFAVQTQHVRAFIVQEVLVSLKTRLWVLLAALAANATALEVVFADHVLVGFALDRLVLDSPHRLVLLYIKLLLDLPRARHGMPTTWSLVDLLM